MTEQFPILDITSDMRIGTEPLGSKPKFWFWRNDEKWLFKQARSNTGEDWAEKVASEIAAMLKLPTHHVELAAWEGRRGCAVKSFLPLGIGELIHGNELLAGIIDGYDKEKDWGQSDHTIDNIVIVLERLFEEKGKQAAFMMTGYLMFDALVGNTDRHHQNWGVILTMKESRNTEHPVTIGLQLAPTFDHASSLGRELLDAAREKYLNGKTVERYIKKAKGGIFGEAGSKHGLGPMAVANILARRYSGFFKPWQERIANFSLQELEAIIAHIPDERITPIGRQFALTLVSVNQQLIREI
jgi:hypothetical protein